MIRNKILFILLLLFVILFINFSYATDINLNTTSVATDNTIYTPSSSEVPDTSTNSIENTVSTDYQPATVSYTDSQDSNELSLSNMINIVLIAVGVVLILLAIAILIKIK